MKDISFYPTETLEPRMATVYHARTPKGLQKNAEPELDVTARSTSRAAAG